MVSKWWMRPGGRIFRRQSPSIENLHQIKSVGFFANFRRFKLNANTCDLSTAVSQGLIARTTATAQQQPKETTGVARCFFCFAWHSGSGWCSCCCPERRRLNSDKLPQIGASEAVSAATAAVSDMSQFCKRQPAACEVGGQAATVIGQRAQEGARKLYQHHHRQDREQDRQHRPRRPTRRGRQESARSYRLDRQRRRCRSCRRLRRATR